MTDFHSAFVRALGGEDDALAEWLAPSDRPKLAVYRNTIASGLSEALEAAFPSVAAAVGPENFSGLAFSFGRDNRPENPCLHDYGKGFADWLDQQRDLEDMGWLGDLARLDRLRLEVVNADDEAASPAQLFAALSPDALNAARARLVASARLIRFDATLLAVWQGLIDGETYPLERQARPEALLVRRVGHEVEMQRLDDASHAFLSACVEGSALGDAALAALTLLPTTDIAALFGEVLGLNILTLKTEETEYGQNAD
ncbi:DNA-binding domain-containing protein [Asticcacaulis sp. AND118]|uniref:HvfC/BufC N-terminal domain-containing protein n=1 Tax=Asticcacaulis sp. AND118 TaxID=2840468 RepID=UPI001D001054|nr:DNA-binding domain-containing protein [Asticcacaulis sp. AND118]UDF05167.1 DNA-binding domain-containing protein [Asticcacaulis sp. AND118]